MTPFVHYGSLHGAITLAGLLLIVGIYRYAGTPLAMARKKRDAWVFFGVMLGIYLFLTVSKIMAGAWTIQGNLPLHLCDISAWTLIYALFSRRRWAMEAGYYWGLTGGLLAFGVPNVTVIDAYLVPFFLWHALLTAIPLYQMQQENYCPSHGGIYRTMAITVAIALVVMVINPLLGSNYMFLSEKIPAMDAIGLPDYPYYLPLTVPLGIAIWYVWWGIAKLLRK